MCVVCVCLRRYFGFGVAGGRRSTLRLKADALNEAGVRHWTTPLEDAVMIVITDIVEVVVVVVVGTD